MYFAIYNVSSKIQISIFRRQRSLRRINLLHRMIVLTMVVILKLFVTNSIGCNRKIYRRTTIFANGFTTVPISSIILPAYVRNFHAQQNIAPKTRIRRQNISFALSEGSVRTEEPDVVIEDVNEGSDVNAMSIPSLITTTSTTTTIATKGIPQPMLDNIPLPTATVILTDDAEFIRPDRDLRSYRFIQLSNNLRCLLVCDNMKSGVGIEAASVHVQAGHFDDTIPGLARTL